MKPVYSFACPNISLMSCAQVDKKAGMDMTAATNRSHFTLHAQAQNQELSGKCSKEYTFQRQTVHVRA